MTPGHFFFLFSVKIEMNENWYIYEKYFLFHLFPVPQGQEGKNVWKKKKKKDKKWRDSQAERLNVFCFTFHYFFSVTSPLSVFSFQNTQL